MNLYYFKIFIMGENINVRTVKNLKAYLNDKIDKLVSSENISHIKALVQEQSNLIVELTETVISQKERMDKLEESLIEWKNSLKVSKTVSSCLVKKCDHLEQYERRLCLKILDLDLDDSKTSHNLFDKCKELSNNLELDIPQACIDRVHRIGKKTSGKVKPMIVRFTTRCHRTIVYIINGKIASIVELLLTFMKTCMDILKEATDFARESDPISYEFANINCSL